MTSLLISTASVEARWAKESDAPFAINLSNSDIQVRKDGSYEAIEEAEFEVLNERGKDLLKVHNIFYQAKTETYRVLSAQTINGKHVTPVSPLNIEDKSIASSREGFSEFHRIAIPFPDVQVGSKLHVKYTHASRATPLKGVYYSANTYGALAPERAGSVQIKSPIPIYVKTNDPWGVLETKNSKHGTNYVIQIKLKSPTFHQIVEEPLGVPEASLRTTAEFSSTKEWNQIAKPYGDALEVAFKEPLPPGLQKIADAASAEKTVEDKINYVVANLVKSLNYLGDWRTVSGEFFPRKLKNIEESKFADCKDYSFASAAIFRKIGLPAKMALVIRKTRSTEMFGPNFSELVGSVPSIHHFNHAIVRIENEGNHIWIDPTNPVSYTKDTFNDIAGQEALVADEKTVALEKIPTNQISTFSRATKTYVSFHSGGDIDVGSELELSGRAAREIMIAAQEFNPEQMKQIIARMTEPKVAPDFLSIDPYQVEGKVLKNLKFNLRYSARDPRLKTSVGPTYPIIAPYAVEPFFTKGSERITGIRLGEIGTYNDELTLHNVAPLGTPPGNCTAHSKWADLERKVETRAKGIRVSTYFAIKASEVAAHEIMGDQFQKLRTELSKCLQAEPLILSYKDGLDIPTPAPSSAAPPPPPSLASKTRELVLKWVSKSEPTPVKSEPISPPYEKVFFSNEMIADKENALVQMKKIDDQMGADFKQFVLIRQMADEYLTHHEKNAQAYHYLGRASLQLGYINGWTNFETEAISEGRKFADRALELDPNLVEALVLRSRIYWIENQNENAKKLIDLALKNDPTNLAALSAAGRMSYMNKQYESTILNCKKGAALSKEPVDKSTFLQLMGEAQFAQKNIDLAFEAYRQSVETAPNEPWIIGNAAGFFLSQNKFEDSIPLYESALKLKNYGNARDGLAKAYAGQGYVEMAKPNRKKEAVSNFLKAIEFNPRLASAYYGLASCYWFLADAEGNQTGYEKLANENAEKAISLDPTLAGKLVRPITRPGTNRVPAFNNPKNE